MTLASTYTYRVLKSSWGVLISITAAALIGQKPGAGAVPLGQGVFLVDATPGEGLSESVMEMLAMGLRPLSPEIASKVSERPAIVSVQEIRYNDCDFQLEGLAVAISAWAVAEFGLPEREIGVTFDREENRYVFDLPGIRGR